MVIYVVWSLLVCLVGLVIYYVTCTGQTNPPPGVLQTKTNQVGLWMFICGLLAFLLQVGGRGVFSVR
jgi:hypothetical protein